jgi:hypothetical protein
MKKRGWKNLKYNRSIWKKERATKRENKGPPDRMREKESERGRERESESEREKERQIRCVRQRIQRCPVITCFSLSLSLSLSHTHIHFLHFAHTLSLSNTHKHTKHTHTHPCILSLIYSSHHKTVWEKSTINFPHLSLVPTKKFERNLSNYKLCQ